MVVLDGGITDRDTGGAMGHDDLRTLTDFQAEEQRILTQLQQARKADWDNRVAYHPPRTLAVQQAHEKARALIGQVGQDLIDLVPPCPDVNRMLDALHEALMLANAAIAIHHPENTEPTT